MSVNYPPFSELGDEQRVVVTGLGTICPVGNDVPAAWRLDEYLATLVTLSAHTQRAYERDSREFAQWCARGACESPAQLQRRPARSIEHPMVAAEARVIRQPHHPQRRRHRSPARRQDGAVEQHQGAVEGRSRGVHERVVREKRWKDLLKLW